VIRLRKTRSSHSALVNVCGGRLNKDRQRASLFLAVALILAGCGSSSTTTTTTGTLIPSLQPYPTPTGTVSTFSATGSIDSNGIFFQKLGTNARACDSCHQLNQGMSISAASTQALFTSTSGTDPLFLAVDGANCPTAATGDSAGHSLVLNNGLIRIAEVLPANVQFQIAVNQDPYGCAVTANSSTGQQTYSVYRRPLPASDLTFLSNVMWDTRETVSPLNSEATLSANLDTDLAAQAANAIATHEQGSTAPTSAQLAQIAAFEEGLYTAQATDTPGRIAEQQRRNRRSRGGCLAKLLSRHQRRIRPGPQRVRPSTPRCSRCSRRGPAAPLQPRPALPAARFFSTPRPSRSPACAASTIMPHWAARQWSMEPAAPVTTRPTSATTRFHWRWISAPAAW
jgi:hypothetical protein